MERVKLVICRYIYDYRCRYKSDYIQVIRVKIIVNLIDKKALLRQEQLNTRSSSTESTQIDNDTKGNRYLSILV